MSDVFSLWYILKIFVSGKMPPREFCTLELVPASFGIEPAGGVMTKFVP